MNIYEYCGAYLKLEYSHTSLFRLRKYPSYMHIHFTCYYTWDVVVIAVYVYASDVLYF